MSTISRKRPLENAEEDVPPAKYQKIAYTVPIMKVKKLSENAKIPVKGSRFAAGYDLHAAYDSEIPANGKGLVKTDIAISIPIGCYGRIAPRSGLAWKHHIDIGAGVIDYDYRGNVGVVMFNHQNKPFKVEKHMRVAQLILERYEHNAILQESDDLDDTIRGDGGFGSTGLVKQIKDTNISINKDNKSKEIEKTNENAKTNVKLNENIETNENSGVLAN